MTKHLPIVESLDHPIGNTGSTGNDVDGRREDPSAVDPLMKVGALAKECGKTVRAIHHYEKVGLLKPQKRSRGRYRLFGQDALDRVKWIGKLNDLGMSLTEIQAILQAWEDSPSAPEAMATLQRVYAEKLADVRAQLARLRTLEQELEASLAYLTTCEACEPRELVAACASCTVHGPEQPEPHLVSGLYACS